MKIFLLYMRNISFIFIYLFIYLFIYTISIVILPVTQSIATDVCQYFLLYYWQMNTSCQNYFEFIHFRHGEKVAGVIAGALNNSECGVGLAYEAKLGGRVIDITLFIT